MSQNSNEVSTRSVDASPIHIHSHSEGLTITLPSVQNARSYLNRTIIFVNLILMGGTFVLLLPLMDADPEGMVSALGIFAFMLVLVNGGWFALRYQGIQRLKGSGRIELNPYLFLMDEWFVPTHLIQSVEYAPPQLTEYEGLRVFWTDDIAVRSCVLQLFIKVEDYQLLAASINTYLSDNKQLIDDATHIDPRLAMPRLIPPRKGRFPISLQDGIVVIRPELPWRSILSGFMYFVVFVSASAYLIPKGFANQELLQEVFQLILADINFKDIVATVMMLGILVGVLLSALFFIYMPFSLIWGIIHDFSPTTFELSPDQLTVKTGKSLMIFPWNEVKGFKLLETILGSSENRSVHHDFVILHQDQEHKLIALVNEGDRIQELAWLKDIFERVWRQAAK